MKTELKKGVWIEGFNSVLGEYNEKLGQYSYYDRDKKLYTMVKLQKFQKRLLKNVCHPKLSTVCYYTRNTIQTTSVMNIL